MTIPQGPGAEEAQTSHPMAAVPGPVTGVVTPFPLRPAVTTVAHRTVAWRAPGVTRFDGRPANDFLTRAEAVVPLRPYRAPQAQTADEPAGWLTFVIGSCVAALLGALLGGIMSV